VTTACNGSAGYTNLLDVYDPAAAAWTSLRGSIAPHGAPAFGVINDKLYVAGGVDGTGNPTNITEVYDPVVNDWTKLASMSIPLKSAASVALNGQLYVFGGYGTTSVSNVQIYNPTTTKWKSYATSLPGATHSAAATVAYGIIFLEAGSDTAGDSLPTNLSLAVPPTLP